MRPFVAFASIVLLLLASLTFAQTPRHEEIRFRKGASSATLTGAIKGYESVDYTLRAKGGQSMVAELKPNNASTYFNVLPPGSEEALFVGSVAGNRFEGALPADGVYTLRVYLMRNAARRNESSTFEFKVGVTGG